VDTLTEFQQAVIDRLEVAVALGVVMGTILIALVAFIAISRLHS
jgi:hypothetical protein